MGEIKNMKCRQFNHLTLYYTAFLCCVNILYTFNKLILFSSTLASIVRYFCLLTQLVCTWHIFFQFQNLFKNIWFCLYLDFCFLVVSRIYYGYSGSWHIPIGILWVLVSGIGNFFHWRFGKGLCYHGTRVKNNETEQNCHKNLPFIDISKATPLKENTRTSA